MQNIKYSLILICAILLASCGNKSVSEKSVVISEKKDKKEVIDTTIIHEKVYQNKLIKPDGTETNLRNVLKQISKKAIVIDIWATWCHDCINGLPKVKALQEKYKNQDVEFVFLSLDRKKDKWKEGVEKHDLKGLHYFVEGGWKSELSKNILLDWIPRYMVVQPNGKIPLFRAIKADDANISLTIDSLLKE